MDASSQYALAYALTTTAGVRALLPLAAFAVAANLGWVHPPQAFAWLSGALVMWILIGVAALEMLGDKVPLLDHAMHFIQVAAKPAAAVILVGGSVHSANHDQLLFLMLMGALNALGIHGAVAATRVASTATTAGLANPLLSIIEDAGAIGALVLGFVTPFIAAVLALGFSVLLAISARSVYRRVR